MSMRFDATLKDLGRDSAADFLATFDRPPRGPLALLNVDLSTVTTAADFVVGLADPLEEIIHFDFQSSAAAWKHAAVLVYNALLYAEYHVAVHSIVILLRPQAAHSNLSGAVSYAARSGRGSMNFTYEVVRLWERPAEELLAGALGTTPLAMLGALPERGADAGRTDRGGSAADRTDRPRGAARAGAQTADGGVLADGIARHARCGPTGFPRSTRDERFGYLHGNYRRGARGRGEECYPPPRAEAVRPSGRIDPREPKRPYGPGTLEEAGRSPP